MNFTREPIIETIISPREGYKLVLRNSKNTGQEDYIVDSVEVISFGNSFFYRCLERPQTFLVPVTDYEMLEVKDTRMVLKNASPERSIKIGGGREQPRRDEQEERDHERQNNDRKGKRRRGRRGRDRGSEPQSAPQESESWEPREAPFGSPQAVPETSPMEEPKAPSFISRLFPPPSTLIKDSISRYKTVEPAPESADDLFPPSSEEPVTFEETFFEGKEVIKDDSEDDNEE